MLTRSLQRIAAPGAAPGELFVAAALRATATAELSYSLITRLADDISRSVQARGSRPIVACLLIRAAPTCRSSGCHVLHVTLRVPRNPRHRLAPPLS